ncbi:hypothetical protein ACPPVO_44405 [Dactylosporangium sp. McL0621]|uniref:hypothetical protein n=1 Tax=Dactylosporangium sp. McL0621 TaxID=3415678 RepID=UPI003CF2DE1E
MTRTGDGADVGGFAALRTVGFEPLAPVTGAAVFSPPLGYDMCWNGPRRNPVVDEVAEQYERDVRELALERMRRACVAAGGHGVVGATLAVRPFLQDSLEYVIAGTAVRAGGSPPRRGARPFTAGVDAAGLAKLLRAGWMPVALIFGVAVRAVHDTSGSLQRSSMDNVELSTSTLLVKAARAAARAALAAGAARAGARSVLLGDTGLKVCEQPCETGRGAVDRDGVEIEAEDRIARADMTGTAIVQLHRPIGAPAGRPLSIMRLDRGRRPATNWRNEP